MYSLVVLVLAVALLRGIVIVAVDGATKALVDDTHNKEVATTTTIVARLLW